MNPVRAQKVTDYKIGDRILYARCKYHLPDGVGFIMVEDYHYDDWLVPVHGVFDGRVTGLTDKWIKVTPFADWWPREDFVVYEKLDD